MPLRWPHVLLLVAAATLALGARAEEARIAEEAAGRYPVQGEFRLRVEGVRGTVFVRAGTEREVRFYSTAAEDREVEIPVGLWTDGSTVRLAPLGASAPESRLEVAVPPGFVVEVRTDRAEVGVSGALGEVEVAGESLDVDVRGLRAAVELDLKGGGAEVTSVEGDVTLRAEGSSVTLYRVEGEVFGALTASRAEMRKLRGALDLDLDGGSLAADEVDGMIRLRGRGGAITIVRARGGGRFEIGEATLVLEECEGDFDIDTDAEVRFRDMNASIHVNSYGGALRGEGNSGLLEAITSGSPVIVEKVAGPVRIQGDNLEVRLKDMAGELLVLADASSIDIEGASGAVVVEAEFSDVRVHSASGAVEVTSRDGEVDLSNLSGPAKIRADGPHVNVAWASLSTSEDSEIVNEGGDVSVSFPQNGGCRVEAESGFGRIESSLPGVRVSDDGSQALGLLNRRRRPTVRIESGGAVRLGLTGSGEDPR